jgi:hypothetical protein
MAEELSAPIANKTIDPSNASDSTRKLMNPNAKEDPECVTGDNPQKAWTGKHSGKPSGPFGQQGKNF